MLCYKYTYLYYIYLFIYARTHAHTHTLDKNGSLYDPAGTESWNMQIRDETTKLTKLRPSSNWKNGLVVLGLATSHPEEKLQVRLHPHTVWSSLARTDSDGFLAPCVI